MLHCMVCKHSLCMKCCYLIVGEQTSLKLVDYGGITSGDQTNKASIEVEYRYKTNPGLKYEIAVTMSSKDDDDGKVVQYSESINYNDNTRLTKVEKMNIQVKFDELEKEFKESQLDCKLQLTVIDPIVMDNNTNSNSKRLKLLSKPYSIPVWINIGYDYNCTFTTLNGIGRYGPTNMNEYKDKCHFNDTKLDNKQKGMQLWTIPKTGKYKVICYGAKGGDSIDGNNYLFGGKGAKIGLIVKLYKNDIVKIACGQKGQDSNDRDILYGDDDGNGGGGGGGGGTYFILYKIGNYNKNPSYNHKANEIVNIPLCIAAGGNGACHANNYHVNGIDGLCDTSENRDNYSGYKTGGMAGRGASFKDDFDIFQSHKFSDSWDYNSCNPKSFVDGAIGGKAFDDNSYDGGFGGGGGSHFEGGGGGGYIGGLVSKCNPDNTDQNKYSAYGALSYICKNDNIVENINIANDSMMTSGTNNDNGKIEVMFLG